MTKKKYALISGILNGVCVIATSIVAYVQPEHAVAIIASIGIAETAVNEILLQFVEEV